mmetsp:Transcript_13650/g.20126  ORF Transcript_13650/g.20126 Transcript_13650/m.20126 type:complete len:284 (-) Transcript_13650:180-1031(-)|eukprot:CAMPEP_0194222130 /NCGR_PEP_ID=MMETSP0156-20130528/32214_1 /TAXON_ID=33649 /ORGANISM="Thalassionema nitzschioides, Strain L26-B" /LENGTH=283 /DNA_ID=CAMNT_0038952783 /DNA_START=63 /DNA_END=914 /DNA_ORIENTATION=+
MGSDETDKITEKQSALEELKAEEAFLEPLKEKLLQLITNENLDEEECRPICEDDNFLRRCLVSSLNDEKKAFKLGTSCLRFRHKYKPRQIKCDDDFPTAASQNFVSFSHGHAKKNGWPVIYLTAKNWNPWKYSTDEYIRMMAFTLETGEQAMDPDQPLSRMYIILDMQKFSLFNNDLRKIRLFAKLTSELYPERCIGVAVNADVVTTIMWNLFAPLLDQRTRDGVAIFRPGRFEGWLQNTIGLDVCPPSLGGTLSEELPPMSGETAEQYHWGNQQKTVLSSSK